MSAMAPVYIVDIIGSSLTIALCFFALLSMRRIYMARKGFGLYTYLYAQTIALCIFAVSRSAGHIIKHVLLTFEYGDVWKMLAPVSGSINSFTFIIFGLAALMYSNIKKASDEMDALEQGRMELKEAKDSVERSLGEKHVLLKEVHHRVKNNMAVITSLLDMQYMIIDEPSFKQVLRECKQRVKAMALVHEKLYKAQDFLQIGMREYVDSLMGDLMDSYGNPDIKATLDISDVRLGLNLLIPLGLIINEIVSNSLKHAFEDIDNPEISVSLKEEGGRVRLVISDNGPGLEEEEDNTQVKTLGVHIINALVGQIDGHMETEFRNGLKYSISFPNAEEED
jgi:two-component sensor histidine kinase